MNVKGTAESKLQWAKTNPSLCVFPYNTLDIRRDRYLDDQLTITCCCNLQTRLYSADTFSDPFEDIKTSMEAGQLPPACQNCISEEDNGGTSERIRGALGEYESSLINFKDTLKTHTFELRIKFGTLCMQACRSCGPSESSVWAAMADTTMGTDIDITDINEYWDLITSSVLKYIDQTEEFCLHLIGGETLVQPGVRKLLEWAELQGFNQRITIRLTTSLSVLPDGLIELFNKFRKVELSLSIDSVGDNYQYVRWPVKFEKIESNVNQLFAYAKRKRHWEMQLIPVFTLNNIFYIDDYLDYWADWFYRNRVQFQILNTNVTMYTQHLDIQALPVKYRAQLKQLLVKCLDHRIFHWFGENLGGLKNFIESTIRELDVWPDNLELWDSYLTFTAEYDEKTQTSLAQLNKKMYNVLLPEDQKLFADKVAAVNTNNKLKIHIDRLSESMIALTVNNRTNAT